MVYLLHGDDIVSSRKRLSELTSGCGSSTFLQGDRASFTEIIQALSSTDMFMEKKCVVMEQISKLGKSDLEKIMIFLDDASKNPSLLVILWQGSEMTKIQVAKFKTASVEVFLLPKLFFTFLDNFLPQSRLYEIKTLSQMTNIDEMQIFYALIKRVRLLLLFKTDGVHEELSKMSSWQIGKLKTQSSQWTLADLERVYGHLFQLERDLKSSGLMLALKKHLDILVAQELH